MDDQNLIRFIEDVCGDSRLRVDEDFGGGFVRLNSSEAERRQAAQDIRSTEDIVIELLRNARDAGAHRIFLAVNRDGDLRTLVAIDDGSGVPSNMQERIFEPRVTSKLDTAHMDKWGMHGRGMALFSIAENSRTACVRDSVVGGGTSILVTTDLKTLGEKRDQSTFPHFESVDGVYAMRGPKNILRTCAEFALEHKNELKVYCGSCTEIAATLYEYACIAVTPAMRAFGCDLATCPLHHRLAYAADPEEFARLSSELGLEMSSRSARRIINKEISALPTLYDRLQSESMPSQKLKAPKAKERRGDAAVKIDRTSLESLEKAASSAFSKIAESYYLDRNVEPSASVRGDELIIRIPLINSLD